MSGHRLVLRTRQYAVLDRTPVWLTVHVGDGHPGSIDLYLNEASPVALNSGKRKRVSAVGENLAGSTANVVCMVRDMRTETNWTSIQIDLSGGVEPKTYKFREEAKRHKGYVMYDIDIKFI